MTIGVQGAKRLVADWLSQREVVVRKCLGIVERNRGDNQGDIATNGELRVMREFLPGARCVFDVGANRGEWTAFALSINGHAEYHCFEPSNATFELLRAKSWPSQVILRNLGLSDKESERLLFIVGAGAGMNSVYNRWDVTAGTETEPVQLTTLDNYAADNRISRIDFLKIDVEGHELNVLKGGERILRSGAAGVIQFEYGGTYLDARIQLKDVYEMVRDLNSGYSLFKVTAAGLRPIPRYHQSLETFQLSNWVFRLASI